MLKGNYSSDMTEFTLTWISGNPKYLDLALFGYPTREATYNSKITVKYTPLNGGTKQYPVTCWSDYYHGSDFEVNGDGTSLKLNSKLYGLIIISPEWSSTICPLPTAEYNGRYEITYSGAGPKDRTAILNIDL